MCFLTYICNYLFLIQTLFYYKNGDPVFHLMEVLLCGYVVLLYRAFCQTVVKLRYQDMISVQCNVNNLLPNVAFSKAILLHENYMSHSISILSGKYIHVHIHFLRHICQKQILQSHHQFHGLALFQKRDFLHRTAAPGFPICLPGVKLDQKQKK